MLSQLQVASVRITIVWRTGERNGTVEQTQHIFINITINYFIDKLSVYHNDEMTHRDHLGNHFDR
jgi:hypothetical protein